MEQHNFKEFSDKILHRETHKNPHKITGSLGVYDAYKYIRKNKWFDLPRALTEKEFYSIIRTTNNLLRDELLKGNTITFPYKLGSLELLKTDVKIEFVDNKLKTNKRVNWLETLKLWHEDPECKRRKTLVRFDDESIIRIQYSRHHACYNNMSFYAFKPNKPLNIEIKKLFSEGLIDAMQVNYGME